MTTRYVDHGAYGATASFSAGTSGSSTTLTLTTPGSFTGNIKPGMFLTGTGISAETYISSVTYNASDVVTAVTMNTARTISAATTITATGAGSPESVPVWGSAQDGDGTASTPGTPSTASIVFTGAPSTGSIAVCGVTLSPTWGASATTAADALAAAINASTTTITGPASFARLSQLRNHIYARGPSTGAAAGTCEIMTRQASASHAGLTAITHTLNNVSSGGTITFSGGTGGCWGYLFNPVVTAWRSAVAVGGYGLWAAALPYCGALDAGDVVKVRSGKVITLATNANVTWTMAAMGSAGSPVRFDIDNSTVWGDGADPVLKITETHTSNSVKTWGHAATTFAHINAKQYSSGQRNLVLEATGYGPTTVTTSLYYGGPVRFENVDLYCPGTPTASPGPQASCMPQLNGGVSSTAGAATIFKNCRLVCPGQAPSSGQYGLIYQSLNGNTRAEFHGCEFALTAPSTAWTHTTNPFNATSPNRLLLDSCVFTGFVSGSRLVSSSVSACSTAQSLYARNCTFGGVTVLGPTYMQLGSSDLETGAGVYVISQYGSREFAVDRSGKFYAEWQAAKGRPTLNARLHDGTTPWSVYVTTTATAANIGRHSPAELPRIGKAVPANADLTEGARTFRLNFLLESNLSWTKQDISILVDYIGTDDVPRTFDTYDPDAGALSTDGTSSWSATTWNGQTWNPKCFSVTTPESVKAGTEVGIYVRIHTTCSADTRGAIIDPEIVIT